MTEISSRQNSEVKEVVGLLGSRKKREEAGLFVTEGFRLTLDAMSSGVGIHKAFFSRTALQKHPEQCDEISLNADQTFCITDDLSVYLGDTKTPQGVFAVCHIPLQKPQEFSLDCRYILLSSLQDPGNVGTIIRTACALGLDGVIMSGDCPDIYSPKVLRSTMGGLFTLPVWVSEEISTTIADMRDSGLVVAASALSEDAISLGDTLRGNISCVVIGNEGSGLSPEIISQCDHTVIIPMSQPGQSLNAAVAASIFMWEMLKQ